MHVTRFMAVQARRRADCGRGDSDLRTACATATATAGRRCANELAQLWERDFDPTARAFDAD